MKNGGSLVSRSVAAVALCGLGMAGCLPDANDLVMEGPEPCSSCSPAPMPKPEFVSSWFALGEDDGRYGARVGLADFNRDGILDVAISRNTHFDMLLGDGSGGFTLTTSLPNGNGGSLAIADFNLDGAPDVLIPALQLGDGKGGFTGGPRYQGEPPRAVAAGDFNEDGKPDYVAGTDYYRAVSVRLGDGAGGFTQTDMQGWGYSRSMLIRDVNRDGHLDLILLFTNNSAQGVSLGDGSGVFAKPKQYAVWPTFGRDVTAADMDGDGNEDLVLAGSDAGGVVGLGDGAGGFTRGPYLQTGPDGKSDTSSVAVADFDANGKPDIAITDTNENTLSVFLNDGTGLKYRQVKMPVGGAVASTATGDLDRDGRPDLVVGTPTGIRIFLNRL